MYQASSSSFATDGFFDRLAPRFDAPDFEVEEDLDEEEEAERFVAIIHTRNKSRSLSDTRERLTAPARAGKAEPARGAVNCGTFGRRPQ
ncbi:hypothetical protein [Marinicauda salina]|uniref:hypothetical protein n=1 Tax=Marinicauda salina TaxID=2135793 RepID=UPI001E2BD820|nr:hypothetical protein [Marinicauda salina]